MKTLKIFLISILILFSIMFSSCAFPFDSSCESTDFSGNSGASQESWTGFVGNYTFEIVEKDGWYYPTLKGEIKTDILPYHLYVTCNDVTTEIEIDKQRKVKNYFLLDFEQEIIYGSLAEGNHRAVITGDFGNKTRTIKYTTDLVADELYTAMAVVKDVFWFDELDENELPLMPFEPGETIYVMDKESNWTRPIILP